MELINTNVDLETLPQIEQVEHHALEPNYLRVSIVSSMLFYVFPAIALIVFYFVKGEELPMILLYIAAGFLLTLIILSVILRIVGFKYKSFGLRDHDIIYKSGWIWRNETIVPFNRIQHVEIAQGPMERYYNLAKLKVFTAGGSQSDLVIPGLDAEKAAEIKAFLIEKSKKHV